jgi:hypothetical protein
LHCAKAAGSTAAAAALVADAEALGVGDGAALAAALGVASGVAVSAGVAVSPGSGSVSAATGVSVGAASSSFGPLSQADRTKTKASAVADIAANFMEGVSFKNLRAGPYRRKPGSGRACGTQDAAAR